MKGVNKEIRKIDPVGMAQMLGLISLVGGLILGIIIILIDIGLGIGQFSLLGGWIILIPVVYALIFAILGIICGLIFAVLYNIFAKRIGGIKIELK